MRKLYLFQPDTERQHLAAAEPGVSIEIIDGPPFTTPVATFCGPTALEAAQKCALLLDDDVPVQTMLDLSTAHMPEADPDWGDERVLPHDYGFILFVRGDPDDDDIESLPEWLKPIYELAIRAGAMLVNFDQDGGRYTCLPSWEW